jgi:hypothetical protein
MDDLLFGDADHVLDRDVDVLDGTLRRVLPSLRPWDHAPSDGLTHGSHAPVAHR